MREMEEKRATPEPIKVRELDALLDRRALAFEMGLGVATAAAVSLSTFSQAQSAVC